MGIKFLCIHSQSFTDGSSDCQPIISVNIDLPHTRLDFHLDHLHWHAVGLMNGTTTLINDCNQIFRNRGGTMHDQVGIGQIAVNLFNLADGQCIYWAESTEVAKQRLCKFKVGP